MKRILCLALALLLFFPSAAAAQPKFDLPQKEEVVYGKMNPSGYVEEVIIVNAFLKQGRELFDYGNYSEVLNLTDTGELRHGFTEVFAETNAQDFFYQGKVRNNLMPWNITFRYELDGRVFSPEALKGQSGNLRICVRVRQNEEVNPVFFENYMLQISMNFNQNYFSHIQSEGATIASAGEMKVVNLTSLPGKDSDFTIEAKAVNAHLGQIQIAGLPFELFMELPDISQYTGELAKLESGIAMLAGGVGGYVDGVNQLIDGISTFTSVLDELPGEDWGLDIDISKLMEHSDELIAASQQFLDLLRKMESSPSTPLSREEITAFLESLRAFSEVFSDLVSGINPDELEGLIHAIRPAVANLDSQISTIEGIADALDASIIIPELNAGGLSNTKLESAVQFIHHTQGQAEKLKAMADELRGTRSSLSVLLDSLETMIGSMTTMQTQYESIHAMIDRMNYTASQISPGGSGARTVELSCFVDMYEKFHNGLVTYFEWMERLAEFKNNSSGISSGLNQLSSAGRQLKDGAYALRSGTANMDEQMKAKMEELMEDYIPGEYELVSFADERNTGIQKVQFIYLAEPHAVEEEAEEVIIEEPPKSLWEKFLDLFR